MAATLTLMVAAPAAAQTDRAYVAGFSGFAISPDTTTANTLGEVGVRVAPHLFAFGNFGQFYDLEPSTLQPAVDSTVSTLSAAGLNVSGSARVPAWYGLGGVRYQIPTSNRISPYVLGGLGFARITPEATFLYTNGTLPDGSTPVTGDDVTSTLVTAGDFAKPPATNAFMFSLGGGVAVPVAQHWAVDVGYRFSRMDTETAIHTQGVTFGFGYRF
jgi:opacity protein-like surface antigen